VEWYHVCWPRLTAKRAEPVVSISWASCLCGCCSMEQRMKLNIYQIVAVGQTVWAYVGVPFGGGRCGPALWDGERGWPQKYASPNLCYYANFGHSNSKSNCMSVIMEIHQKIVTLAFRLSRSVKVTGTDTDLSAAYDFLLVIHNNHRPMNHLHCTFCKIKSDICKFSQPRVFNAPDEGFPLEFCNGAGTLKN